MKTIHRRRAALLALLGAATVSGAAGAHHSFAIFDSSKLIAIKGTVTQWVWANPHSWIYLNVQKANGASETWAFECGGPNQMARWGWKYSDIHLGDKIAIDTHPGRNGDHIGNVSEVFLADGTTRADTMGSQNAGGDALVTGPGKLPSKPQGTPYN